VSDGKLLLNLEEAEEGGYVVTSPLNPELITQAETIEEAFANARDAAKALRQSRAKLMRRLSASKTPGSANRYWAVDWSKHGNSREPRHRADSSLGLSVAWYCNGLRAKKKMEGALADVALTIRRDLHRRRH